MLEKLRKTGRGAWLDEEMERLADPANYANDPDAGLEAGQGAEPQARRARPAEGARRLARDSRRGRKNLPRGRIIKDETLADIAVPSAAQARTISAKVRGLSAGWAGNDIGARLMAALDSAEPLPDDEMPPRDDAGPGLGKEGALVADLLKLLLKIRSRETDVAPRLIARARRARSARRGPARGAADPGGLALRAVRQAMRSTWSRAGWPSACVNGKMVMSEIS